MKVTLDEKEKQLIEQGEEEELYEHHKVVVDPGQEMIRIDKYLMDRLPNTTRNRIQNSAKNGFIVVNGSKVKQNYKIKPNDVISLVLPFPVQELDLVPENIPIDIPYEDDDLLIVNKPPNMIKIINFIAFISLTLNVI